MRATLLSISVLLISGFFMIIGNGIINTLIPLRAHLEGFSTITIGIIGSAQSIGFVLGCLMCPLVVRRAGHIRAFASFAAVAACAVLIFALVVHPVAWILMRAVMGLCFAGLFMVIESWLNERSRNEYRGQIFSIYQVILMIGITGGQQILGVIDISQFHLFSIAAILITIALIPVSLTRSMSPAPIESVKPRILWLIGVSPMAVLGCGLVGMANGALWSLAPVFARQHGFETAAIGWFMSAIIVGGAITQWPVGRLSDKLDRRWVIVGAAIGSAAIGLTLFIAPDPSMIVLMVLAACYGGLALTLYSLCIAHVNDLAKPEEFIHVSSGMLMMFGCGGIIGPVLASLMMDNISYSALFLFTTIIHTTIALFCIYRLVIMPRSVLEGREPFVVSMPKPAPSTSMLDPRSES